LATALAACALVAVAAAGHYPLAPVLVELDWDLLLLQIVLVVVRIVLHIVPSQHHRTFLPSVMLTVKGSEGE